MTCGVGVIGAGTVGGGVIQTLLHNQDIISERAGAPVRLVHVADKFQEQMDAFELEDISTCNDAYKLIEDPEVQVVCELIGGTEPARSFITAALNAGKNVVTANKMLLAMHGEELHEIAVKNGVELRYEAAVAGGIPIIKALKEGLSANNIHALYGILNGTCNYILTKMSQEGRFFKDVLVDAQEKGFAETPPDLDIAGHDSAHKCQILASLAYSTRVNLEDIYVEGITHITQADVTYAGDMGFVIKLLAVIQQVNGAIDTRVQPMLVPQELLLASVNDEFNAIYVESDTAGPTLYYGRGAGRLPTASAVVADIVDIVQRKNAPAPPPFRYSNELPIRDVGEMESQFYLRFNTQDHPGVLGRICTILGEHDVGIASCYQNEESADTPANVVIMTYKTREENIRKALADIDPLYFTVEPTQLIRVMHHH